MLMDRLKNHEPDTFNSAAAILQTGDMPSLLFRPGLCTVNPALLYLMHASTGAGVSGHTYLPACPSAGPRLTVPTTAQSNELPCDAGEGQGLAVGEVWWLFNSGSPYLAEVFKCGAVPEKRLPHMDKSSIGGRHVARILGRRTRFIQMVALTARMCLFSAWCVLGTVTSAVAGQSRVLLRSPCWCPGRQHPKRRQSRRESKCALGGARQLERWRRKLWQLDAKLPRCITCALENWSWTRGNWTWLL
jgi:hypothetical protein